VIGPQLEILLLAVVTAVACAIPGVFLVLRRMSLMSDAISHSILLGIVLAFFWTHSLNSPLLIVAATLTGVLTVALVEVLFRTRLVKEDAAIGIVFPALFSIGVILVSRHAADVHLDVDAVLVGELAFAPFRRLELWGADLGPRGLWSMTGILLLNLAFVTALYKELKLTTFDELLAAALGFSPVLVHYAFMAMVSVTAVGAFDVVGSILVIALMIAPPATAYLLTDRLRTMLVLSALIGASSALTGYGLSFALDASIAGSMAAMSGLHFTGGLLLAPRQGVLARAALRHRQRADFARLTLLIHLHDHETGPEAETENRIEHLGEHLGWDPARAGGIVQDAERRGFLRIAAGGRMTLTEEGRAEARIALERTMLAT
jgi:manganese/zinc/iron transport system permease protein